MSWLIDPVTRQPLPAYDARPMPTPEDHTGRWTEYREDGVIVRLGWSPCDCEDCEAQWVLDRRP